MPSGFSNFTVVATQQRLGAYSSNKASYASTGSSFTGQFQPVDPKMSVNLGLMGQAYSFIVDGNADIKASDILTINSTDYHVAGVQRFTQASIDILKCILTLSVKV